MLRETVSGSVECIIISRDSTVRCMKPIQNILIA